MKDHDLDWLRERAAAWGDIPAEGRKADQLYSLVEVAHQAGVEVPEVEDMLRRALIELQRSKAGPNSLSPEVIIFRAAVIACVNALVCTRMHVTAARRHVAELCGASRADVARWHKDQGKQAAFSVAPSTVRYIMTIPDQVAAFTTEIHKKNNSMEPLKVVEWVFRHINKPDD